MKTETSGKLRMTRHEKARVRQSARDDNKRIGRGTAYQRKQARGWVVVEKQRKNPAIVQKNSTI